MSRFLYLTDTHLGCTEAGYWLQPRYLNRFEELMDALGRWLREHPVDCLIHGGDATDHGTATQIDQAVARFGALGVPAYLCLGNHDLMQPDSIDLWRSRGQALLPQGRASYGLDLGAYRIYVLAHHWHQAAQPFHWQADLPQEPLITPDEQRALDAFLAESAQPTIVVTHAPLNAVPPMQTGQHEPFHPPHAPYAEVFHRLAEKHAHFRLALTGHNHVQSACDHGPFVSCTTAAFSERPGLARLVTITEQGFEVETIDFGRLAGLPTELAAEHVWAAGESLSRLLTVSGAGSKAKGVLNG